MAATYSVPSVIVYPLSASATVVDPEAGSRIATLLATQLAVGGGIRVIAPTPGTERKDFLTAARAAGATYYVTGFVTPLGNGASIVAQVVSTQSGIVAFSSTSQVSSYSEISSQGDDLRASIIAHANRNAQAFVPPAPAAAPAATPDVQPSTGGADVSIGGLFHKRKSASAPAVALAPLNATLAVLAVGGSADADQRVLAAQAISQSLQHNGRVATGVTDAAPSKAVCASSKASAMIASWLDLKATSPSQASASLRFIVYDCGGNDVYDRTFVKNAGTAQLALSGAADLAVGAFLNSGTRR